MRLNIKVGLSLLLGLATARFAFHLAKWSYNVFDEPLDVRKVVIEYGAPIAATLIWMWIVEMIFKRGTK